MNVSRAPGAPCGSVFGRFLVLSWVLQSSTVKTEILNLKELPNERLEGSWCALWLGIRTFFGLKLGVVGLQGLGLFARNIGILLCLLTLLYLLYLTLLTYFTYLLYLL